MTGCIKGIGQIEIKAENGQQSILFNELVNYHNGNLDLAYRDYLSLQSKQAKAMGSNANLDINGEFAIADALDILYEEQQAQLSKPLHTYLLDSLKAFEERILPPDVDAEGNQVGFYKFVDKLGNLIKELIRTSTVIDRMAYGGAALTNKEGKDSTTIIAERNASLAFKGKDLKGTIEENGIEYTYDDYVATQKKILSSGATKGTLVHAKIEQYMAKLQGNDVLASELQQKIEEIELKEGISSSKFDWITDGDKGIWEHLIKSLGIRFDGDNPTKIMSELRVGDETLGMASTIDIIVEDPTTGRLKIGDFKTGSRFLDSRNSTTMVFGKEITPIFNTAKNRARLQVMMNAVAIKAANPDAKFDAPVIIWIPNEEIAAGKKNIYTVDVRDYLRMIERHYAKEQPDVYKELLKKSPNIFNPSHYGGSLNTSFTQDMIDDTTGMRADEKLMELKLELEQLELNIRLRPDGPESSKGQAYPHEVEKRGELLQKILQADSTVALPVNYSSLNEQEIGVMKKWLGGLTDVNSPYAKAYSQTLARASANFQAENSRINTQFNTLLQKAVTKIYGDNFKDKVITMDKSKLWDKLIQRNLVEDEDGVQKMVIGMKLETDAGYSSLPSELKELSKFMRENMKEVFNEVLVTGKNASIIEDAKGNKRTKLDIYNKSKGSKLTYEDNFIPKTSITDREIRKKFDWTSAKGLKDIWKYWKVRHLTEWFETTIEGHNQGDYGIPIKYVGTSAAITNVDTASLDLERSFKLYMESMLTKKHYDSAYATGMALSGFIRQTSTSQNLADHIEHAVNRNILKMGNEGDIKLTTNGVRVATVDGRDVYLSPRKILRTMGRGVVSVGLWINWPSMFKNAAQAEFAIVKEALLYGNGANKDVTLSNYRKAKTKMLGLQYDFAHGKGKSNPVHVLMKEFNLYPEIKSDYYDEVMGASKNISPDILTSGYQHAEEMTTASLVVAHMMSLKITSGKYAGKSMWEVYEKSVVVDKQTGYAHFELPADFSRGNLKLGDGAIEEVKGLHAFEIQRIKSMIRQLKGGYRKEERSYLEATYLGEALMIYRRWLPASVVGNWKGKQEDISVGNLEAVKDENGQEYLEWKARIVEGRLRTIFNMITTYAGLNNTHKWEDLSEEQKKGVKDVGVSLITWAAGAAAIGMLWDDDEDKETRKFMFSLDSRFVEHINPMAIMTLGETSAIIKTVNELSTGLKETSVGAISYGLTGEEDDLYTQKGDIRGLRRIRRNLPFGAALGAYDSVEKVIEEN